MAAKFTMSLDAIIIGGSFAGLSAALTLGRSLLKVACIDAGKPCNRFADHSHNSIAFDGENPVKVLADAKLKVLKYDTVKFYDDEVLDVDQNGDMFQVSTKLNGILKAKKLIFANGVTDKVEESGIHNLGQFWGKTAIHCPYCHGYEIKGKRIALYYKEKWLVDHMIKMVYNWSKDLVILSNEFDMPDDERILYEKMGIKVENKAVDHLEGTGDQLEKVVFHDNTSTEIAGLYLMPAVDYKLSNVLSKLKVEQEHSYIKVDEMMKTNVPCVYACGDCTTPMRSVTTAMYQGMVAGVMCSKDIFAETWSHAMSKLE